MKKKWTRKENYNSTTLANMNSVFFIFILTLTLSFFVVVCKTYDLIYEGTLIDSETKNVYDMVNDVNGYYVFETYNYFDYVSKKQKNCTTMFPSFFKFTGTDKEYKKDEKMKYILLFEKGNGCVAF